MARPMRFRALAAFAMLLAFASSAIPVTAKGPFQVVISRYDTGEFVADLSDEPRLLAFTDALYAHDATPLPPAAMPAAWDHRLVAYWDAARQHPTELLYAIPRDGHLGILYWSEASRYRSDVEGALLQQSARFDAMMAPYTGVSPPENPVPPTIPGSGSEAGWVLPAVVAVGAASILACLAWRMVRRRSTRPEP